MKKIQFKSFVLLMLVSFLSSFSCAAQPTLEEPLSQNFSTSRQYICIGDSITNGHGNTSFEAYPHQLALLLGSANSYKEFGDPNYIQRPLPEGWLIQNPANSTTVINHGLESQKIQTMLANIETQVGSRLSGASETTVILMGGINDIIQGRTAADIQADWVAYGAWCRARNVKLYVATITPLAYPTWDPIRVQADAWLLANWHTFADRLVNFVGNEALADPTNLTYFHTDGGHIRAAGNLRMAQIVNAVINGTYQSPTIKTTRVSDGNFKIAYRETLSVSGGDGTITWSHRSGNLPPGISFNAATHTFEGTPTTIGIFPNIVIRATDATGDFHERQYTIHSVCNPDFTRNC